MNAVLFFRMGAEYLGMNIDDIDRVMENEDVNPVAHTAPWFMGLIYSRGQLLEVVDLAGLLTGHGGRMGRRGRLLVVRNRNGKLALAVDEIVGLSGFGRRGRVKKIDDEITATARVLTANDIWEKIGLS